MYIALGNNDSGCGDYQLDEEDPLLTGTGAAIACGWFGAPLSDVKKARADYDRLGSYTLPLQRTVRAKAGCMVVDDLYLSSRFNNCKGKPDAAGCHDLLAWMDTELSAAERRGEFVWVLTHIPPGINTYSTNANGIDVCAGETADDLSRSPPRMTAVLARHAAVVRVMIAGHTHVDESRVFGSDEGAAPAASL